MVFSFPEERGVAKKSKADYKDIDPLYGSLNDVDELIRELRNRNMKLMMDLVVNHTSDQVRSAGAGLLIRLCKLTAKNFRVASPG